MEVDSRLGDVLSCLDDIEGIVWEPYHKDGPGRPPRNPLTRARIYKHRASVERTISRLKQHLNLENHKVKGLRNIAIHVPPCLIAMLLLALTAIKLGKPKQIRAITKLT